MNKLKPEQVLAWVSIPTETESSIVRPKLGRLYHVDGHTVSSDGYRMHIAPSLLDAPIVLKNEKMESIFRPHLTAKSEKQPLTTVAVGDIQPMLAGYQLVARVAGYVIDWHFWSDALHDGAQQVVIKDLVESGLHFAFDTGLSAIIMPMNDSVKITSWRLSSDAIRAAHRYRKAVKLRDKTESRIEELEELYFPSDAMAVHHEALRLDLSRRMERLDQIMHQLDRIIYAETDAKHGITRYSEAQS